MAVLAVLVAGLGVVLGILVLPEVVVVGGFEVVVGGRVVVGGGLVVGLGGRVARLLGCCHGVESPWSARDVGPDLASGRAVVAQHATVRRALPRVQDEGRDSRGF